MIGRGEDGYYHPSNEEEIVELIGHARDNGLKVRVRGSAHSVEAAIYTADFQTPPDSEIHVNIYLDRMIEVSFDDDKQQVTVKAGCHLGEDPVDPAGTSTVENSLFYQLDRKDRSLLVWHESGGSRRGLLSQLLGETEEV